MQRRYTVLLTLLCTLAANLPATSASAQERPIQAVLASDASQTLAALEAMAEQGLEIEGWIRDVWATGEAGAQVHAGEAADDPIVATLAPGIFLKGWRRLEGGAIFVRLGVGENNLTGCIKEYTWADNGAHCPVGYPVYQQAGTLVERLGYTADGREIVRRDGEIELPAHWTAQGAVALEEQGRYFVYPEPMNGEISDAEIIRLALQELINSGEPDRLTGEPLTAQMLEALQARVERWVDPQFGVRTAMVYLEDEQGNCRAVAEVDPASGWVVATNDNG